MNSEFSYFNGHPFYSEMPCYYDAYGHKQTNYAYHYGPHLGKVCSCPECTAFNQEAQSREENYKRRKRLRSQVVESFQYECRNSGSGGYIGLRQAMQLAEWIAEKHLADYQKTIMELFQSVTISHAAQIAALKVSTEAEAKAEELLTRQRESAERSQLRGRMFRVEGQDGPEVSD